MRVQEIHNYNNMKDFNYYAPTEVVFGKQSEEQVAALVKKYGGTKVLVHYGGKSAERSGLLDKICGLLTDGGIAVVKLGGVVPNPRLSLAQKGIELCRKEGVDFILAIGGGSVIDSAKCIAYGVCMEGNVWDLYLGKVEAPKTMLPVASVLTIPAAGSEMSEASVITNEDGDVKIGYSNNMSRHHEPRAHNDITALSDCCRRDRYDDAHHGTLFHEGRRHGLHDRPGRSRSA